MFTKIQKIHIIFCAKRTLYHIEKSFSNIMDVKLLTANRIVSNEEKCA